MAKKNEANTQRQRLTRRKISLNSKMTQIAEEFLDMIFLVRIFCRGNSRKEVR